MKLLHKAALWCALASASLPSLAAQDQREIMQLIGSCLIEYAPDDWQTFIVTVDESKPPENGRKVIEFEHKVVVGEVSNPPQDLRPCLPTYVPGKLNELRETLPRDSRGWVKAVLTVQRSGKFDVKYTQPDELQKDTP